MFVTLHDNANKNLAKDRIMYLFSFPIVPFRFNQQIYIHTDRKNVIPIEKLMDYKADKSLVRISKTTKHMYRRRKKKHARSNRFHDVQKQNFTSSYSRKTVCGVISRIAAKMNL